MNFTPAFGQPGQRPTRLPPGRDFVTAALGPGRVWATVTNGAVREVCWPTASDPQLHELNFVLVGQGRITVPGETGHDMLRTPRPHLPVPLIEHRGPNWRLMLEVLPDPLRDVLLVRYAHEGEDRLYALITPHPGPAGDDATAWVDAEGGALHVQRDGQALAVVLDRPLGHASVGFHGVSDGLSDLREHGEMRWAFQRAERGCVSLTLELPPGQGTLAIGFAAHSRSARTLAASGISEGFGVARARFIDEWRIWGERLHVPRVSESIEAEARLSATMLKVHEDRTFPGAIIASPDHGEGAEEPVCAPAHLVWPRVSVSAAFGLLAAGQADDARRVLAWLLAVQHPDGYWLRALHPDGRVGRTLLDLDATAQAVLLTAALHERGLLTDMPGAWPAVRRAVGHLVRHGPGIPPDLWAPGLGFSPYALSAVVAALVASGAFLDGPERAQALALADDWNERVEALTFVTDSPLAQAVGGYYARLVPAAHETPDAVRVQRSGSERPVAALVSLDALHLVRYGLRDAHDPRVESTLRAARDLRSDGRLAGLTHRLLTDEGGAALPLRPGGALAALLASEEGHLAALRGEDALGRLEALRHAAPGGAPRTHPEGGVYPDRPVGSDASLLVAHAEFLQLLDARANDRPTLLTARAAAHFRQQRASAAQHWRDAAPLPELPAGRALRVEGLAPFTLHVGFDGWQDVRDIDSSPAGFGVHRAELSAQDLLGRSVLNFTRKYAGNWEGRDHHVTLTTTEQRDVRPAGRPVRTGG